MSGKGRKATPSIAGPPNKKATQGGKDGSKDPNLNLLKLPADVRQEWFSALFPTESPSAMSSTTEESSNSPPPDFLQRLKDFCGNSSQADKNEEDLPEAEDPKDAMQVAKLLQNFKEKEAFGETIHDKDGIKVGFMRVGQNARYTVNKDIQLDFNVYNGEMYVHLKKKFSKTAEMQALLLGKDVDASYLEFATQLLKVGTKK
ncbi:hypothetical protein Fcan01_24896 [Folsomia candida]|uniref:Uncharacterized protein n=1 Tax=Folsomia candida TaxID=158441 RepID=A0A226D502_FOLCA|nr:hypothetical protein Fcan01_24896 [Folsomia candida]